MFNNAISFILPNNQNIFLSHFVKKELTCEPFYETEATSGLDDYKIKKQTYYGPEFRFQVRDVLVDTQTGIVFIDHLSPKAILESSNILAIEVGDYIRRRRQREVEIGIWTSLSSRSYAHWLLQDFPGFIRYMELNREAKVAIASKPPSYVNDSLKLLEITPSKKSEILRAEYFEFIGAQYAVALPSLRDLKTLKDFQQERIKTVEGEGIPSKIYISRRKSNRPLKDEILVHDIMTSKGFAIVYLEDMDWESQIQLFSNAEFIIGTHGAGLANIVWCQNSPKVIEIYDPNFQQESLMMLGKKLNISYSRITADEFLKSNWSV